MGTVARRASFTALIAVLTAALFLAAVLWLFVNDSSGQTVQNPWSEPANLSQSGSGGAPQLFVDSGGVMRALWPDSVVNSFAYTVLQEGSWIAPLAVEFPFGSRDYYPDLLPEEPTPLFTPILAAGNTGVLHALWRDDEDALFYSNVPNAEFGATSSWLTRTQLSSASVSADLATLTDGRAIAVYIQPEDLTDYPAGVYFRSAGNNGTSWSTPAPLHLSSYYRLLTTETANVQLGVDSQNRIYVAWDDWANERILFIHSPDGGATWSELSEIDKRQAVDAPEVTGPAKVLLTTMGDTVHLTWQAGHEEDTCNQYYRSTADAGNTWQDRQQILNSLFNCPATVYLLSDQSNLLVMAEESDQRYLTYRGEGGWSDEQLQPALAGFRNPATNQEIAFSCGQDVDLAGEFIWVTSCGEAVGSDVWLQLRSLSEFISSLAVTNAWQPVTVIETTAGFASPQSVTDEEDRIHVLWGGPGPGSSAAPEPESTAIKYSRWEDGRWSRMSDGPDVSGAPDHNVSVAVDGKGFILAVWQGGESGSVYFSQSATSEALFSSEWREPLQLTDTSLSTGMPDIAVDGAGTLFVVYAVPINEGRGIYLLKSEDGGASWSTPALIFDGVAAGWELVESPRLAVSDHGVLHLMWTKGSPSSVDAGDELYYSRSEDGGQVWAEAQRVVSANEQGIQLQGFALESAADATVHRVWQEWNLGHLSILHQVSFDNGLNWQPLVLVSTIDVAQLPAALTLDAAGQLHLLFPRSRGAAGDGLSPYSIEHYMWDGAGWRQQDSISLRATGVTAVSSLTAAAAGDQLVAVIGGSQSGETLIELLYTQRQIELPADLEAPETLVTSTPVPLETPIPSPTPPPSPTPTVVLSSIFDKGQLPLVGQLGQFGGVVVGLAVALVILVPLFLLLRIRQVWPRDRK